jgi:flagellin
MLHRIRELAVQGANDTNEPEDREKMQEEIDQLFREIKDIAYKTEFNTIKVLAGEAQALPHSYDDDDCDFRGLKIQIGANRGMTMTINIPDIRAIMDNAAMTNFPQSMEIFSNGVSTGLFTKPNFDTTAEPNPFPLHPITYVEEPAYSGIYILSPKADTPLPGVVNASGNSVAFDLTNANLTFKYSYRDDSEMLYAAYRVNVLTVTDSTNTIHFCDDAMNEISVLRARLGAYENRLRHTETNLNSTNEHTKAALSRVIDTDMALEMTNNTQASIIQQAGIAILGQANARPQQILQLLR